jgi:acetoacetyl-CoA synthetase
MAPLWTASLERRQDSRLTAFARAAPETAAFADDFDYAGLHSWSIAQREAFWSRLWDFCGVIGDKGARIVANGDKMPGARWFPDARLNYAQNLLRPRALDETAIVFAGERRVRRSLTYGKLLEETAALAAYLASQGVAPGDRVAAYVHNGPEAVIGLLAAASIGAVWASCSPDFGVAGVLDRFAQIAPKALIVSDGYFYKDEIIERLGHAREIAAELPSVRETLVIPYVRASSKGFARARAWPDALAAHKGAAPRFLPLPFDHPLCIMFSSGTTGAPKCIVHGAGGALLQHLKEHRLQCDVRPGDRVFYATTTGWMMWNWLVSALTSRAAILLYDGFAMDRNGAALIDFAQDARATLFGVSAGYLRAIEKQGLKPRETHDLAALRIITSTGSPLAPESFDYVYRDVKPDVHLASISGGTDILSCFVLGNPWSPVLRGEIQGAGLGLAVEVWDADGKRIFDKEGELVCTKPFPATPIGFWNDPEGAPASGEAGAKYRSAYFSQFPNVWRHGDFATQTPGGGFIIHGRSDATLKPRGVRIGTADIYRVVENLAEVDEALAVAQEWEGGERILLFVKLRSGCALDGKLERAIRDKLEREASPRHVPAEILAAPELPHTRSGKLVELAVRDILRGRPVRNREALANPQSLDFFANLAARGAA